MAATPSQEKLGAVSWPADGVSAADISGIGVTDGPGATQQVPIASVAKLMTASVILQNHPLSAGGSGPDVTVEPSELSFTKPPAGFSAPTAPLPEGATAMQRLLHLTGR